VGVAPLVLGDNPRLWRPQPRLLRHMVPLLVVEQLVVLAFGSSPLVGLELLVVVVVEEVVALVLVVVEVVVVVVVVVPLELVLVGLGCRWFGHKLGQCMVLQQRQQHLDQQQQLLRMGTTRSDRAHRT